MAGETLHDVRSDSVSRTVRPWLTRAGLLIVALATAAVASVMVDSGPQRTVEALGGPLGAGGEFHSITPARILDSRKPTSDVAPFGRKPSNTLETSTTFDVSVLGRNGIPAALDADEDGFDDSVLAVVVNIIVIDPTSNGYLRAFPTGSTEGTTSVVNFRVGAAVPNAAVLRPGTDGKISLRLVTREGAGSAHVAIDISGWFSTSQYIEGADGGRGARLIPIEPIRAYDSRLPQFGASNLGGGSQVVIPIWGAVDAWSPGFSIPDDENIKGVAVNVTGQNTFGGSTKTYLSALPERLPDGAKPLTSTVNLLPGQVRANLAILPVGADGSITVFNRAGETRVVVDIMGYLLDGTPVESQLGRVIPLVGPYRSFDTRQLDFGAQPLGPGRAEDWSFQDFVDDVKIDGDPVGPQVGLLGNLTATGLGREHAWAAVSTYLTAYPTPPPDDQTPPIVSNLNLVENESVPNLGLFTYGGTDGDPYQLRFFNRAGYLDYLLDVYAVVLAADPVNG